MRNPSRHLEDESTRITGTCLRHALLLKIFEKEIDGKSAYIKQPSLYVRKKNAKDRVSKKWFE